MEEGLLEDASHGRGRSVDDGRERIVDARPRQERFIFELRLRGAKLDKVRGRSRDRLCRPCLLEAFRVAVPALVVMKMVRVEPHGDAFEEGRPFARPHLPREAFGLRRHLFEVVSVDLDDRHRE